jgi:CxxC-x17-CxxC domain-containing protein
MTAFADKALRCVGCQTEFVFSAREQEFHASKGFTNEPRRCPECRRARREGAEREGRQNSGAGDSGQTGDRSLGRGETRRFLGVCSACGGEASLPFEPTGNRPVLCSRCYDKIRVPA